MADNFEYRLKDAIEHTAETTETPAFVERKRQAKGTSQAYDVMALLSEHGTDTQGIIVEAKSRKFDNQKRLYFEHDFEDGQLDGLQEIAHSTGLVPLVAVEVKMGRGKSRRAYMIHLRELIELQKEGHKSINLREEEIREQVSPDMIWRFDLCQHDEGPYYDFPERLLAQIL